jgi:hypothetical protein
MPASKKNEQNQQVTYCTGLSSEHWASAHMGRQANPINIARREHLLGETENPLL